DILNMIPPTGGRLGRLVLEDAMRFDVAEFRHRSGIMRDHARAAGRNPDDIALSQFVFVTLGADSTAADAMLAAMAQMMGIDDVARARESPSVLAGDAASCRAELARRSEELGVSYFFCRFTDGDTMERFAAEVIAKL